MLFEYGGFEYLDLSSEQKKEQDVFIATGTPWGWELGDSFFSDFRNRTKDKK
jgi:hypothetical protein